MRNKTLITMISAACAEIQERCIADAWLDVMPFGVRVRLYPHNVKYEENSSDQRLASFEWYRHETSAELETVLAALERILEEAK